MQVHFLCRADQIQVGDLIDPEVEMAYIVERTSRQSPDLAPAEIKAVGGWVSLVGDTTDGYYRGYYEGPQDYYAAPDALISVHRDLDKFRPLAKDPAHDHHIDNVVGYVVRETIRSGEVLRDEAGRVGIDKVVVEGGTEYGRAREYARRYIAQRGGYAVVDNLYGCGCRGGQR